MSTKQARTRTLGQLLSMNYFGYFIGSLAAGVLLALAEFDFVFGTVILVNCASVLTTIFCMRESVAVVMSDTAEFRSRHFRFAFHFCEVNIEFFRAVNIGTAQKNSRTTTRTVRTFWRRSLTKQKKRVCMACV